MVVCSPLRVLAERISRLESNINTALGSYGSRSLNKHIVLLLFGAFECIVRSSLRQQLLLMLLHLLLLAIILAVNGELRIIKP